jgi:hypothetical protein
MDSAIASFEEKYVHSNSKFSYLADRTMTFIDSVGPCAFIYRGAMDNNHATRLGQLVKANGVDRFMVNLVGPNDTYQCLSQPDYPGVLRIYFDDENHGQDSGRSWQGCDKAWDDAISSLPITPCWNRL